MAIRRFEQRLGTDALLASATLSLAYSTYLGGSGSDSSGNGIAVDRAGDAYVTGSTNSSDFPLAHPLPSNNGAGAFVSKLSFDAKSATLSLAYSTYLGGSGDDLGLGIAVDRASNAYVTGYTDSADFPLVHPLPSDSSLRGATDAFVSKLSFDVKSATLSLAYSTYLGGSGEGQQGRGGIADQGTGIAVDRAGDAYVTGGTTSADFPLAHPLPSNSGLRGSPDAFVTKLSFEESNKANDFGHDCNEDQHDEHQEEVQK